ncbi:MULTISPECIES: chloride channel protein [unclassified Frankia]|uniref:chloride channel protein n=1 Tax=unclassified Frankia TaxID=2632575 RepID=UPI002AD49798|nr:MULTISPECIES: chloride channel protein [unclassified Frankia]
MGIDPGGIVWRRPADWPFVPKWLLIGCAVGAIAGFGAVGLYELVKLATTWLLVWATGTEPATTVAEAPVHGVIQGTRWWLLPAVVGGGAFISTLLVKLVAPESAGHGTDAAIKAIHYDPTSMRARVPVVKLLASAGTLGSGGSGGTEGPIAQMSAAIGSTLARKLHLSVADAKIVVTAGLAAGIGAIFRSPFAGALLGVEMLYVRDMAPAIPLPAFAASVTGYLVFSSVVGFDRIFEGVGVFHVGIGEILLFVALGLVVGLLGRLFVWFFYLVDRTFVKIGRFPVLRPALGGLAVGVIGMVLPGVLGTGYGNIQVGLDRHLLLAMPLWAVLLLPVGKIVATSLSVGSGGSAGIFGPGLVVGAAAGAALWRLSDLAGVAPPDPGVMVIVGMAACLGPIVHAPIALTVMAIETTREVTLAVPVMIAMAVALTVVGDTTLYRSQLLTRDVSTTESAGAHVVPVPRTRA